ncbi:ABC transporter ATP-binding protein [Candidatus Atribacteria bacterium 1244-E10-H5-B2]|nr:MAG: ABC transporter ATP-binding protein [Candidatus Atribacteria bacterium 1244-E10-H5-B2]
MKRDTSKITNLTKVEKVEMRGIVKQFPGVLANNNINFDVHTGEVHTLLGENGAGKSTLMKILYGIYHQDEGEIYVNGKLVTIRSPLDSIRLGIGMVHQHFMLVPTLTVAENVALGLPSSRKFLLDLDVVSERIKELAKIHGLYVDPGAKVWQLSVGEQQRVEIMKILYRGASLLILDEPTAVLTPQEVEELFRVLRSMVKRGYTIIFISHKLREVLSLSNRITILRDGHVVDTLPAAEATQEKLARLMVGREVLFQVEHPSVKLGRATLVLEGICVQGDEDLPALRGIDLEVRSGEILGIAGVSGNGQSELAEVITGLRKPTKGKVYIKGTEVTNWAPSQLLEHGLSYIPEERMRDGTIQKFTVEENLILKDHIHQPYTDGIFMNFKNIARESERRISDFDIRTPSRYTSLKSLSGGNIQKLILARELSRKPGVLIASQPTRGLDVSATEYVHRQLIEQRTKLKTATLLISDDLDEILSLADRIAVIYEGKIMGVVKRNEVSVEELGMMMGGVLK